MANDHDIIVFAGPSVYGLDTSVYARVALRPPAEHGDLLTAAQAGARRIGLIDGVFGDVRSVWHKEILYALARGVQVFGASSLGALRAAECAAFGMIGVGTIFRDYHSGARVADADVAVVHAPASMAYRPLTVPLVDVDATVVNLLAQGTIREDEARAIRASAEAIHFADRTWVGVVRGTGLPMDDQSRLSDLVLRAAVSQKTRDAAELLTIIDASVAVSPPTQGWHFQRTAFFDRLDRTLEGDLQGHGRDSRP